MFGKISAESHEKLEIADSKLLPYGEVPLSWLEEFKEFTTWHRMTYNCANHCEEKFHSLNDLLLHNGQYVKVKDRRITCIPCDKVFQGLRYLPSYINHMSRSHYEYIKFCCVVCSSVFQSIPFLSKHYKANHPNRHLVMYPCLDCGLHCQSIRHLKAHKVQHDKK